MPTSSLTLAQAQRLLAQFRAGSLSQVAFCRKHRVSPALFSYWAVKDRARSSASVQTLLPSPVFHEVRLPPPSPPLEPCRLTLPSGAKLEFPAALLRDALAFLAGKEAVC